MIRFDRATESERLVLDAALEAYGIVLNDRLRLTRSRSIRDDIAWRRYLVAELRDKLRAG